MSNTWSKISTVTGDNDQRYGGRSSAMSGDGHFIAIGSDLNNRRLDRGPVTTYKRTAGNNWVKVGTPIFKGPDRSRFGTSISLSEDGSVMAVGAPGDNGAGSAHIFKLIPFSMFTFPAPLSRSNFTSSKVIRGTLSF